MARECNPKIWPRVSSYTLAGLEGSEAEPFGMAVFGRKWPRRWSALPCRVANIVVLARLAQQIETPLRRVRVRILDAW